jgi:hypothetical protein
MHSGKVYVIHMSSLRADAQLRADVTHSGKVDMIHISSMQRSTPLL